MVGVSVFGYIYCVRNRLNGKGYVGKTTKTPAMRWKRHLDEAAAKRLNGTWMVSRALCHAIRKHDVDAFDVEVLFTLEHIDDGFNDVKLLDELERAFIVLEDTLSPRGYNMQEGGDGGDSPSLHTKEHAERSKSWMVITTPVEHAERSKSWMVNTTPEEHAKRCGKDDSRHAELSGGKRVRCVELDRTFVSACAAQCELRAEGYKVRRDCVGFCANGKRKTHAGFTWEWV